MLSLSTVNHTEYLIAWISLSEELPSLHAACGKHKLLDPAAIILIVSSYEPLLDNDLFASSFCLDRLRLSFRLYCLNMKRILGAFIFFTFS